MPDASSGATAASAAAPEPEPPAPPAVPAQKRGKLLRDRLVHEAEA